MKNRKKGFTLVEIIVVLVVIGILLAIAVPSILGYVQKADEEKILVKARNVLQSAKGEAVELYAHDEIERLENDDEIAQIIMKDSGVDGTLLDISMNSSKNSSGDFLVKIDGCYVYYDDTANKFIIKDTMDAAIRPEDIKNALLADEGITAIINDYFKVDKGRTSIDSEGTNFGAKIMNILKEKGYDTSAFSFRIYHNGNINTITISSKKITTEMKDTKEKVEVVQYDYGSDSTYASTPTIRTGHAAVETKKVDGKVTIPYLLLDDMEWE